MTIRAQLAGGIGETGKRRAAQAVGLLHGILCPAVTAHLFNQRSEEV